MLLRFIHNGFIYTGVVRYAIERPVESSMRLEADLDANWFGKRLTLKRDGTGVVTSIRLEMQVAGDDMVKQTVTMTGSMPALRAQGGLKTHNELERDIQSIESTLAFYFGLKRIRWEEAKSIAVPETEGERANIQFNNFVMRRHVEDNPHDVKTEDLVGVLQIAYGCRDLAPVVAFYREGTNDLVVQRYITAFFSFYFVIEGLYANGKTNREVVLKNYLAAQPLVAAVTDIVSLGPPPSATRASVYSINRILKRFGRSYDVAGVLDMLILMRGDLHHFTHKATKPKGTPFTHHRYETLARFTQIITNRVLLLEMNARIEQLS